LAAADQAGTASAKLPMSLKKFADLAASHRDNFLVPVWKKET
jgi:hypothetical protein